MADRDEYVDFQKALDELNLSEEELKKLVSEGDIRAIRGEHNMMKFRREEIERLKQDTGKTIQYTEDSSDTLTDDLLFDEEDELDVEDEGMATAQISSSETFVEERGAPAPAASTSRPAAVSGGATASVRRTTGRSTRIRQSTAEVEASGIGMGMTALLVASFLVGLYAACVWYDIASNKVTSVTQGVVNMAADSFAGIKKS